MRAVFVLLLTLAACAKVAPTQPSLIDLQIANLNQSIDQMQKQWAVEEEFVAPPPTSTTPMVEIVEFNASTAKGITKKLAELDAQGHQEIMIKINSYGGSIHWGMEIIQFVEAMKTPVTCVVDWKAYSMGAFLLESGACDKRLMTKRSTLLFHEALAGQTSGNSHELKNTAEHLAALSEALIAATAERMEMTEEELTEKVNAKNWTISYKNAEKYHAVDGIISPADLPPVIEFEKPSLLELLFGG